MAAHKGKPSGKVAESKNNPGIKSDERERSPVSGAFGDDLRGEVIEIHPAGLGDDSQNAGGPDHHGLDEHEDRNP